ncbi:MAG: SAM-dependent methyltransferase [Nitrosomonas sp.]|jgi:16S rRNA (cytidine1402-2'-O)-methyltransferase|uniref:SAM-dependent methyltransferase n=1 Tax=Nitrosomonas sp. TaxID=42353 RepID=UPI001D454EA5|nr:SAM-dependent methyltransferase [Nitrosomonas sp.]MBX9894172.1 SAM-dependent methyltransferase [Nitrosomonas sp.]
MAGTLYLIPSPISQENIAWVLPAAVQQCVAGLSHFIVEHPKTARQFLKQIDCKQPLQSLQMQTLNEHTSSKDLSGLLEPLLAGHDVGLLSEAGCPAVADPGAGLIRLAHKNNITVIPLVGPSSILLALMASGLNGQCFAFHGYLPVESVARVQKIMELEKLSASLQQTQIFIEAPYRNQKLLEQLVSVCRDTTDLCVASHLTFSSEMIATRTIKEWRKNLPDINKIPTIFLLHG